MFFQSVRASRLERTRPLPGDRIIREAVGSLTHAVTIQCGRKALWPWLAQMGAGRAGWYSYDFIDNGRQRSAERVVPQLQTIEAGDLFPALPGATEGFIVVQHKPEDFLVLGWPSKDGTYGVTWTFLLDELGPDRTRLIVRARAARGYRFAGRLPAPISMLFAPAAHFIMQRKQLLGIARRAEQPWRRERKSS